MRTIKISNDEYEGILQFANGGSYTHTEVTVLGPDFEEVEGARDAGGYCHVVVENAYHATVLRVYGNGAVALVERDDE
jgi:hypothetical protein